MHTYIDKTLFIIYWGVRLKLERDSICISFDRSCMNSIDCSGFSHINKLMGRKEHILDLGSLKIIFENLKKHRNRRVKVAKVECSYYKQGFKYSGPKIPTSFFPLIILLQKLSFKGLKPENFAFFINANCHFWQVNFSVLPFFVYVLLLHVKISGPMYLKLCECNNCIPL